MFNPFNIALDIFSFICDLTRTSNRNDELSKRNETTNEKREKKHSQNCRDPYSDWVHSSVECMCNYKRLHLHFTVCAQIDEDDCDDVMLANESFLLQNRH